MHEDSSEHNDAGETASPNVNDAKKWLVMLERASWILILTTVFLVPIFYVRASLNVYEIPKIAIFSVLLFLAYALMLPVWILRFRRPSTAWVTLLPVLALLVLTVLSMFYSIHPRVSWQGSFARQNGVRTFLLYVAWYLLVRSSLCSRQRVRMLIWAVVLAVLPSLAFGFMQYLGWDPTSSETTALRTRPHGTLSFVNLLAGYLSFVLPLCATLLIDLFAFHDRRTFSKVFYRGVQTVLLIAIFIGGWFLLLATYCRGAWWATLLFFLCLPVGWVLLDLKKHLWRNWKTFAMIAMLALGTTLFYRLTQTIELSQAKESDDLEAVTKRSVLERLASSVDTGELTITTRLRMWSMGWEIVKTYPCLGSGPETFLLLFPMYRSTADIKLFGKYALLENLHNEMLHLAANCGLLAACAYIWMLLAHGLVAWRKMKRLTDTRSKLIFASVFFVLLGYLARSQVNVNSVENSLFFWTALATLGSLAGFSEDRRFRNVGSPILSVVLLCVSLFMCVVVSVSAVKGYLASTLASQGNHDVWRDDYQTALDSYRRAVQLAPFEETYQERLGRACISTAKGSDRKEYWLSKALQHFDKLIDFSPMNFSHWLDRGRAYVVFGDLVDPSTYPNAIRDIQKALELAPGQADVYSYLGQIYVRLKDWDLAYTETKRAIALDPVNTFYRQTLGNIFMAQDRFKDAESEFRKILRLSPTEASALNNLGVALARQGRKEEAERAFRVALRRFPGHSEARMNLNSLQGETTSPGQLKLSDTE